MFAYSKVTLYILILEEVTSVNISMYRATRIQDLAGLTTPALLPQLPRAGGPPVFMARLLNPYLCCLCNKRRNLARTLQLCDILPAIAQSRLQSFYLILSYQSHHGVVW
jgi:hypothetical protein